MTHRLLEDEYIAAQIEDAVRPFVGRLSDEELAWMRASLAALLEDDPGAAALLRGAYPREVDESGKRVKPPFARDDAEGERHGSGSA